MNDAFSMMRGHLFWHQQLVGNIFHVLCQCSLCYYLVKHVAYVDIILLFWLLRDMMTIVTERYIRQHMTCMVAITYIKHYILIKVGLDKFSSVYFIGGFYIFQ